MRTPQQTMKEAIESGAVQAWIDGKPIEYTGDPTNHWTKFSGEEPPHFNTPIWHWRPAPEPKLRPWKPEEVPHNCWIRRSDDAVILWRPLTIYRKGITFATATPGRGACVESRCFEYLLDKTEHSTDGGKTWAPCGVMEGVE